MNWETGLKRGPFTEIQTRQLVEVIPRLDKGQVQWLSGYLTGMSSVFADDDLLVLPQLKVPETQPVPESEPIWILYGTHTGNSERLAKESAKKMADVGLEAKVIDMGSFKTKEILKIRKLLIIVSTDGEGDPPLQAEDFLSFLHSKKCPDLSLISYGVLALGDSSYINFCETGKDFDAVLEKAGARRIANRVDCDVDFEDGFNHWIEEIVSDLGQLSVGDAGVLINGFSAAETKPESRIIYNRKNPFSASILEKINLNGRNSTKETIHLELDLQNSGLTYEPGDALGIYALNSRKVIDPVLDLLHFSGEEEVKTYQGIKTLTEAIVSDYELTPLTAVSVQRYAEITGSNRLKEMAADRALLAEYLYGRDIYDLLREDPYGLTPEEFISILHKNMPRMYSIASSQRTVKDEVHVVVSVVRYEAFGRRKEGHCSSFLADRMEAGDALKVFVDQNSRFKLPVDPGKPVIMVGAGTGVAPFRSFMQQRETEEDAGKSWLFFGERNFTTDFLYQTEWLQYLKEGILTRADVAFSRDQDRKIYVQDKMLEHGKELYDWLEKGAHFYVCGDKDHLAKDVDMTLRKIIRVHGGMTDDKAAEYVRSLQLSDRYQTDVY